ncbi:MAG: PEP-CTERM sorting domain-containing protein [Burkholderiales bacterium]
MRTLLSIVSLLAVASPAFALPTARVPEPETLVLLGVAAVAAFLVARKKK